MTKIVYSCCGKGDVLSLCKIHIFVESVLLNCTYHEFSVIGWSILRW